MGPDFYQRNGKQLYSLLQDTEADIGNMLNLQLPNWMPHPAARRLGQSKDRVEKTLMERLRTRDKRPQRSKNAYDYLSYTLGDTACAHLNEFYASHHTLLMFAAHTITVASISWTTVEVGFQVSLYFIPLFFQYLDIHQNRASQIAQAHRFTAVRTSRLHRPSKAGARPIFTPIKKKTGPLFTRKPARCASPVDRWTSPSQMEKGVDFPYLTHRGPDVYPRADEWHPELTSGILSAGC